MTYCTDCTYCTHPRAGTWHKIHTYGTYVCMRRIALVAGTQVHIVPRIVFSPVFTDFPRARALEKSVK